MKTEKWAVLCTALAVVWTCSAAEKSALNPVTLKKAPDHKPVPIVVTGEAKAVIVAPKGVQGAHDLQKYIEAATGVKLAITNKVVKPAIVLGDCPEAAALGLDSAKLPIEGFAIKTAEDQVFIVGNGGGQLWGVYEFLERFVGMRWYFISPQPDGSDLGQSIPKTKNLSVAATWLEDAPVFRKREIWPGCSIPSHGAGLQLGPLHTFLRSDDTWPVLLRVHQPNWAGVEEYRKNRQEVYQLKSDGTRDYNVLCYGNPKTLESYLEQIQNLVNKTPYHLGVAGKAITVSPQDVELACYCKDCQKLVDPNGGGYGTYSKVMATFVDKLAREVQKRWPNEGFTIIFLPYLNYTMAPDGFKFPGNVEVQICGMPGMASYKEPAIRDSEQANLDKWLAISGRKIQNWHYDVWPAHKTSAAYHYPHVVKDYYTRNRDKTVGSFINGEFDHWPRQNISLYCWLKCLWNPDFDVDAAVDEFCARMFGPAEKTMRELVGLQTDRWEKSVWPGGRFSPKGIYEVSFPRDIVKRMEALLQKAKEEAKGDPLVTARLKYYAPALEAFFKESKDLSEGTGLKPLPAQKVGENPKVDGKLDEPVWGRASSNSFIQAMGVNRGKPAIFATFVQAVWTPEGITFGFKMMEPHMDKLCTTHGGHDNGEMWWDDNVELFLDVTGKKEGEFHQFIVNPNCAYWDSKVKDASWECKGMKMAAFKGPDFWSLEVFLPYAGFPEAAVPMLSSDKRWYGNFMRHRVADGPREYQRMNTTGASTSDNQADFAEIRFIE
ncbi:MAG: DUF4838 domain-containing protein [Lentisphaerae bacterium]|nr:DUF4838 domain-containing protein [Lentisphaerota bacterium]